MNLGNVIRSAPPSRRPEGASPDCGKGEAGTSLPAGAGPVKDDRALLDMMMEDAERQDAIWMPKGKWVDYARRVRETLERDGLAGFRTNPGIVKGFASAGALAPEKPLVPWKRRIWDLIENMPPISRVVAEYRRQLSASHKVRLRNEKSLAKHVLNRIAGSFPEIRPPRGLTNGGADDGFLWRGHEISAAWAPYVSRAADLYAAMGDTAVASILEIGPGLGYSTLAHVAVNSRLRTVVNVDIPPILYISTQYLKSIPGLDVVDYRATRDLKKVEIEADGARPRVYQLAPWQLPRLSGSVDVLLNAASFQEMDRAACENYAALCRPLVRRCVMLLVGDPRDPQTGVAVPSTFVLDLFRGEFPDVEVLESGWCDDFEFFGTFKTLETGGYAEVIMRRGGRAAAAQDGQAT